MQRSTAQLQEKLHHLAGKQEVIKSQSLDVSVGVLSRNLLKSELSLLLGNSGETLCITFSF